MCPRCLQLQLGRVVDDVARQELAGQPFSLFLIDPGLEGKAVCRAHPHEDCNPFLQLAFDVLNHSGALARVSNGGFGETHRAMLWAKALSECVLGHNAERPASSIAWLGLGVAEDPWPSGHGQMGFLKIPGLPAMAGWDS